LSVGNPLAGSGTLKFLLETTMSLVRKIIVSLLVVGLLGCAGAGQKTGEFVDDSTITTKVKTGLFNDPVTSGWKVN
jgi:hypothetical protein